MWWLEAVNDTNLVEVRDCPRNEECGRPFFFCNQIVPGMMDLTCDIVFPCPNPRIRYSTCCVLPTKEDFIQISKKFCISSNGIEDLMRVFGVSSIFGPCIDCLKLMQALHCFV
jgi:hypothetical protein